MKRPTRSAILLIVSGLAMVCAIVLYRNGQVTVVGRVEHLKLEGGFYGIEGDLWTSIFSCPNEARRCNCSSRQENPTIWNQRTGRGDAIGVVVVSR